MQVMMRVGGNHPMRKGCVVILLQRLMYGATRAHALNKYFKVALRLVFMTCLLMISVYWLGENRPAWAQNNAAAPTFNFRVDHLEAETKKVGEAPTGVTVRNGNDQDN